VNLHEGSLELLNLSRRAPRPVGRRKKSVFKATELNKISEKPIVVVTYVIDAHTLIANNFSWPHTRRP
jgi:hypothetical protein